MSGKKRKSTDDDPAVAVAAAATVLDNGVTASSKKRRRLSDGESIRDPEPEKKKNSSKDKKDRKDKREKREKKEKKEKSKGKKSKHADVPPDADEEIQTSSLKIVPKIEYEASDVKVKPTKTKSSSSVHDSPAPVSTEATKVNPSTKKDKKSKKKDKKSKKKDKKSEKDGDTPMGDADDATETQEQEAPEEATTASGDKTSHDRFIVFVGNLPFSATTADVESHFSSLHPTSVRLLHQRDDPTKSRGIAFVEFAGFDHMKTCLKTMHHSDFTLPNGKETRKINVELTAGGGGSKSQHRRDKIRAKNEKLHDQRVRRAREEERIKAKKLREKQSGKGGNGDEEEKEKEKEKEAEDEGRFVHPSRRRRVPGSS